MQRLFVRLATYLLGSSTRPPASVPPATPSGTELIPRYGSLGLRLWDRWMNESSPELLGQERTQDVLVIGFCAAFSLIGWLMVMQGYDQLQRARAIERWPTVEGTIIAVDVQAVESREGPRWRPQVTYAYTVRGRLITATRITSGKAPNINDEIEARDYARKFLPQTPVKVYYNPAEMTESVLEPGTPRSTHLNLGLGAGLACLGPGLFLLFWIPSSRQRRWRRRASASPAALPPAEQSATLRPTPGA